MKGVYVAGRFLAVVPLLAVSGAILAASDASPKLQDPVVEFRRLSSTGKTSSCSPDDKLTLPVDLADGIAFEATVDEETGHLKILYRMNFNQVTEGWNWHPEAKLETEDYYRFKYLPLGTVAEDRGTYRFEDKIGEPQDVRIQWRYAYFFAFDNLYDFFPRRIDDDSGFSAEIAMPRAEAERLAQGDLRMALRGHPGHTCVSESTTFWKATYGKPVDFTLKKRYLEGTLDEVWFYDNATQRVLARLAGQGQKTGQ